MILTFKFSNFCGLGGKLMSANEKRPPKDQPKDTGIPAQEKPALPESIQDLYAEDSSSSCVVFSSPQPTDEVLSDTMADPGHHENDTQEPGSEENTEPETRRPRDSTLEHEHQPAASIDSEGALDLEPTVVEDPMEAVVEPPAQAPSKAPMEIDKEESTTIESLDTLDVSIQEESSVDTVEVEHPSVRLADDADLKEQLPDAGGKGSQPAPFDPHKAPQWQSLLSEYERELEAMGDSPDAAVLLFETGKIWEEKLAQTQSAWQAYLKALQIHPQLKPNIRAAQRLASQLGNWNLALQIIDTELKITGDDHQKAHLLHARGLILEEKLGQIQTARESYESALVLLPDNVEILRQIERLAISTADWDRVLEVRDRLLVVLDDKKTIIQLLLSTAKIFQSQYNEEQRAEGYYLRALELDPKNRMAIKAIRKIYANTDRFEKLISMLQKEAELAEDPIDAGHIYYKMSRIYRENLGNEDQAIEALKNAARINQNDHMILSEMAQLYENIMSWQELVVVLSKQVQVITDRQELVSLYFKLGNIWEEKLFNEDQAIPHYRKVVELNASYLPALQALGRLYYRKGMWADLVQMYDVEIQATKDTRQRSVKLYKLAEILEERLNRDEEATHRLEQCLALNPGYLPAIKTLGELYTKYNRWESLIHMFENELDVTSDHDQSISLLDKIGSIWEEKLNNIDQAIIAYQRILKKSTNYLPAIRSLGKLYIRADMWEDLIRINEREAQLVNDQKQVISLLHRNGELYEEKLNDKDKAIETYKEVLALAPAYMPALQSLGRLYYIKGMWNELITMNRQEIEVTRDESQKVSMLYKIGELHEEKLVQEDDAIAAYQEVLVIQPSNFPSLKALIRIHTNKRDWESLLDILEQEAAILEDPNQKTISLFKVAEIWEMHLEQPERAIETLQRILKIVATHNPTIQALKRLHAKVKDWRALMSVFEHELSTVSTQTRQAEILFSMAEIYASQINDLAKAAEYYERILSIQDSLPSLEALERIYLAQRNYKSLIRIYEAMASRTKDPQLQISLQKQIADIKENRLQPPQNATRNYLNILALQPNHPQAMRALDSLYHKFGTWAGLRLLYERALGCTTRIDDLLDLCMRLADLAENHLALPHVAIHYYDEALKLTPDHLPAIKALKRIQISRDNAAAVINLLQIEGKITQDPHQAISTLLMAGEFYRDRFSNPQQAIDCFWQVLERDPNEAQAFEQLEALLRDQQDWPGLAQLYKTRIKTTKESRTRIELQLKMGALLRSPLKRMEQAAECYGQVLKVNPSHPEALSSLAEISFELEDWDESIKLSTRMIELTNEPKALAKADYRLGVIYQEKQPDLNRAIQHLIAVVQRNPADIQALGRLKTIYCAQQQWSAAVETLCRLSQTDTQNRNKHFLECARIYERGINSPEKAIETYQQILQFEPKNMEVLEKLADLFLRLERWNDYTQTLQACIRFIPAGQEGLLDLHLRSAKVFDEQLQQRENAIREYLKVTAIAPNHPEAHLALADLYGRSAEYFPSAILAHRRLLESHPFRIDSYHELRRIFLEQKAYDKAFCACAVLHCLRASDPSEEFFYSENAGKPIEPSESRLSVDEINRLLIHPAERSLIRKILMIVGRHLGKVYPADLARHSIGKGDRTRPGEPLHNLLSDIATRLGEVAFDAYHSSQPNYSVVIENTNPPSLVIGDGLVKRTQLTQQRFAMGRAIKRAMDGSFLAAQLGGKELSRLLAALIRNSLPDVAMDSFGMEVPEDFSKRIHKALPRRSRKELDTLLKKEQALPEQPLGVDSYLLGAEHSAVRAGLAMGNDLANAIMFLFREIPDLKNKQLNTSNEIITTLSSYPVFGELLRFTVSEEYFTLRARLNTAIQVKSR
jgi:tetratricopeptide (TPR) repeat protein